MKTPSGMRSRTATLLSLAILLLTGCSNPGDTAGVTSAAQMGLAARDNDATALVQAALQRDDALKSAKITVVTTKGDVRLTGVLDNQAQIDRAISLARSIGGVLAIHDELTIKQ